MENTKNNEAEQAHEILNSIKKNGLTIPQKCSVRGALKSPEQTHLFCHNQVRLAPGKEDAACVALSYHTKEGMLGISLERNFKHYSPLEISFSAFNSIVFIFKLDKLYTLDMKNGRSVRTMDDIMTVELSKGSVQGGLFQEVRRTNGHVSPQDIYAIMVPYHLVSTVKGVFSDAKIIPTSAAQKKVIDDPIEIFANGKSIENTNIVFPNYANGLRLFRKAFPEIHQFGIHLTRLPQYYPIAVLSEPASSYQKKYNSGYMKSLCLSGLSQQQQSLIESDPRFFIFPGKAVSKLQVYCHLEYYPYLRLVVTEFKKLLKAATVCQNRFRQKKALGFFQTAEEVEQLPLNTVVLRSNRTFDDGMTSNDFLMDSSR